MATSVLILTSCNRKLIRNAGMRDWMGVWVPTVRSWICAQLTPRFEFARGSRVRLPPAVSALNNLAERLKKAGERYVGAFRMTNIVGRSAPPRLIRKRQLNP